MFHVLAILCYVTDSFQTSNIKTIQLLTNDMGRIGHGIVEALPVRKRGWGYLSICSSEINRHFPLFPKIKILIFYVSCSQNYLCSSVPFIFRLLFPYPHSPEINGIVPLFPKIPGRAS